jgi:hypothetical protein
MSSLDSVLFGMSVVRNMSCIGPGVLTDLGVRVLIGRGNQLR